MGNFEGLVHHGTAFEPKQCLYQDVAMGMQNLESNRLLAAINALGFTGRQRTRVYTSPYRVDYWNLGNFEGFDHHGTTLEPKQCLYQNVAMGMQNLKCNRLVGAINALGFTGWQNTSVHTPPYRAENWNLGKSEGFGHHGTAFQPKQCLYQNVAMGMLNQKM